MGDLIDNGTDLETLIACPVCDTLHHVADVPDGAKARCRRCHSVLVAPLSGAMTRIVMLAATALILLVAAVFFPFLDLQVSSLHQDSSIFDAVLAYSDGLLLPLSFVLAALIIVLPAVRLAALIYALMPMMIGSAPARYAVPAFRLAQRLKPWAMAEIFIVGVVVALVKVAGLATISFGPAFWAFVALVLVMALKDTFMCRLTIWKTLDERRNS